MSNLEPETIQHTPRDLVTTPSNAPMQEISATYTQNARGRITAMPFAASLILLGGLLLAQNYLENLAISWPIAVLMLTVGLSLTYVFRFFISGRRERGTFFLALTLLSVGIALGVLVLMANSFPADEWWPLCIVAVGAATCLTWGLEREHERGLLGVGLLLLLSGSVALAVTLGAVPQTVLDHAADYFPLVLVFIGITLIPVGVMGASRH